MIQKEDFSQVDVRVLMKTTEEMLKIIEIQTQCYIDIKKKLIDKMKKPNLSLQTGDHFDITMNYDIPDIEKLKQNLTNLGSKIHQLEQERKNLKKQTDSLVARLTSENEELKNEISFLKKRIKSLEGK